MNDAILLDGFHAVKHALRFGAEMDAIVTIDLDALKQLAEELAPDISDELLRRAKVVSLAEFKQFSPGAHPTGVAAIARRPIYVQPPESHEQRQSPAILLEDPRRLGNIGAVIRVAAAADAASVLTTGTVDPWHPAAIRGSAGLHYALPVAHLVDLNSLEGPIITLDPQGAPLNEVTIPPNAILAFGTEREGLSPELRRRASQSVALPMRSGVSSLNLATSVAATLYALRLVR